MPRLVGYFWKVTGNKNGVGWTYFCTIAKTEQEAIEYAKAKGYKNPVAEKWPTKKEPKVADIGFKSAAKFDKQVETKSCFPPKENTNAVASMQNLPS